MPTKGTSHRQQVNGLKRIAGQINGVINMVEEQRYCIDILIQLKAVKAAVSTIERKIIDEHLSHCVQSAIHSKNADKSDKMLKEISDLLKSVRI